MNKDTFTTTFEDKFEFITITEDRKWKPNEELKKKVFKELIKDEVFEKDEKEELQKFVKKITRENLPVEYRKTEEKDKVYEFYPRTSKFSVDLMKENEEEFKKGLENLLKCITKHYIKLIRNLEKDKRTKKDDTKVDELQNFLEKKFTKLYKKYRVEGFYRIKKADFDKEF